MFGLSQSAGYAIRALSCLESRRCANKSVGGVAACSGIPRPYLGKIARRLVTAGLLRSRRGKHGGLQLARPAARISLLSVAEAMDGPGFLDGCLLGSGPCAEDPDCPLHAFWKAERDRVRAVLSARTLADVASYEDTKVHRPRTRARRMRLCA